MWFIIVKDKNRFNDEITHVFSNESSSRIKMLDVIQECYRKNFNWIEISHNRWRDQNDNDVFDLIIEKGFIDDNTGEMILSTGEGIRLYPDNTG